MAASELQPSRRNFLMKTGTAAAALGLGGTSPSSLYAQARDPSIDHTIRIGPISLELAPGKIVKTTGYNDTVPGPVLRLQEGKPVVINVINDAGYPDLIHWHGLYLPSIQDGAMEEGSPIIAPGKSLLYTFTPKPTGTRWYHSHAMAGTDWTRSTYSGEYGFLIVEPERVTLPATTARSCLPRISGRANGSACRIFAKARHPITGWGSCITRRRSATACLDTASRSG
jgi:FtsP/CotA-like multicopper oxidase with cupredoxin domain